MKTLIKLPVSTVKVIIAIVMLLTGVLILAIAIIIHTDPKALLPKKKNGSKENKRTEA